jgi:C1A family cysteine protease
MPGSYTDLRSRFDGVRDQGSRPTCLAFAVTAIHEVRRTRLGEVPEDLSEEGLYWGCKRTDGDTKRGSKFTSAQTALDRWGQPLEAVWPYDPKRDDRRSWGARRDAGGPHWYKNQLRWVRVSEQDMKTEIDGGVPVAVGLLLTRGFLAAPAGQIPDPVPGESTFGGHAVTIVGYEERTAPVFIVRNSWGSGWGDGGYGYLPYRYLTLVREAWAVI